MIAVVATLVKSFGPIRIYALDIFLFPLAAFVLVRNLAGDTNLKFYWQSIDTTVVALFVAITMSCCLSENVSRSLVPLCDWFRVLVAWFTVRCIAAEYIETATFSKIIFWIGIGLLTVGVLQKVTNSPIGLVGNYFGSNLEQNVSKEQLGNRVVQRISGTTSNPNIYGQWLNLFSIFAVIQLAVFRKNLTATIVACCCLGIILATAARANLIASLLATLMILWLMRDSIGRIMLPAMFVLGAGAILVVSFSDNLGFVDDIEIVTNRFDRQLSSSMESDRVRLVRMGLETIQKDPKTLLFGVGAHNFHVAYHGFSETAPLTSVRSGVHNVWLKLASECGLLVTLLFFTFLAQASLQVARMIRILPSDCPEATWCKLLVAILVPYWLVTSQLYESAVTYHILIPLFCFVGIFLSRTEAYLRNNFDLNGEHFHE